MIRISENKSEAWSLFRKAVFRFLFIFITSFIFVFNNGTFPLYGYINTPLNDLMHLVTPWFAKTVLGYTYDYSIFVNGSGDTSYAWVSLLLLITFALAASLIWSLTDSKRPHYNTLYYWLTVLIRYYIAFMLINYGVIKVMHAQMPPPTLTRLIQPLGEFSPMGLAWTFIGYSKGYNILIGIAEILSVFLLFRKTMVLGCHWRLIIFEFNNDHVLVRGSYYSPIYQTVIIDHQKKKITLNQIQYDYKINQNADILLRKVFDDRVEEIKLIKQDPQQFELLTHPFRWIQEFPHNR